jgi:hypothetical protein
VALPFVLRAWQGRGKAQRLDVDNVKGLADLAHFPFLPRLAVRLRAALPVRLKYTEDTRELATRKSLLLKRLQMAILCFSSVYFWW